MPSAPAAAILPARPTDTLEPPLIPLLDLLADLIAQDVLAQRRESNIGFGPEERHALTEVEAVSSFTRNSGTSQSDSQIPTKVSSKVPPNSHRHPQADDPVITQENKI